MCDYEIKKRVFDWDIKQYIKLVSLKNTIQLFGSSNIENIQYYKDYDAFERIVYTDLNKRSAIKTFKFALYGVISRIILKKDVIFSELKCGYDKTFDSLLNNAKKKDKSSCIELIKKHITNKHFGIKFGLKLKIILNRKNWNEILIKLVTKYFYTLRWSTKDILNLKKELADGTYLKLVDAIAQKTLIKMDIIIPVRHIYRELSVIYDVSYYTKKKRKIQLTASMDNNYYVDGISNDIMYYYDNNIGKSCKRMYFLCKHLIEKNPKNMEVCKMIKILDLVLNEDCGKLDKILDEVEVLLNCIQLIQYLDKKKAIHIQKIIMQIYAFHPRIIDTFEITDKQSYKLKNKLSNAIMKIVKALFKENLKINTDGEIIYHDDEQSFIKLLMENLQKLIDLLKPIIDGLYVTHLRKHRLNKIDFQKFTQKVKSNYNNNQ